MFHLFKATGLLFAVFALQSMCFGQASAVNGEITGTITDPSGAALPGATVEVINTGTGLKQSVTTTIPACTGSVCFHLEVTTWTYKPRGSDLCTRRGW